MESFSLSLILDRNLAAKSRKDPSEFRLDGCCFVSLKSVRLLFSIASFGFFCSNGGDGGGGGIDENLDGLRMLPPVDVSVSVEETACSCSDDGRGGATMVEEAMFDVDAHG